MLNTKLIAVVILLLFCNLKMDAKPLKLKKEKVIFYGNFALQFGRFSAVNISPTVGYRIDTSFVAGVGPIFNYVNDNHSQYSYYSYGARVFGKYYFFENLFLIGEYQVLNNYWVGNNYRTWLDIPLLGAGYQQLLGNHFFLDFSLLWNFNSNSLQYYSNPIVRGGVSFR
jgi:hypothetical protein